MMCPQAPNSLLDCINCTGMCKTGCQTQHCSCKKANLTCTELYSCFNWHNTAPKIANDEDILNDIPGEIRSSDEDDWDKFI